MATRDHHWVQSRNQDGQILVLTAVSMIALLGIMALSLDASFMFEKRNRLHAAADAAAKSAAIEIVRNPSVSQASLQKFADQQVIAHGFLPTRQGGTTAVVINRGPSSGTYAGNVNYVEAITSEPTSTFFAKIAGWISMTPRASAVAGGGNPATCVVTMQNLSIGNVSMTLNGCGAGVGGNLLGTNPNAEIVGTPTPGVGVTGTCSGTCTGMGSLTTGAPAPSDHLAGLPLPANPGGGCPAGVAASLSPGCYSSIESTVTSLSGGGTGIYYVTGPVTVGNLSGTGVMLFLTGAGELKSSGTGSRLTLSAPTSGTYTGIALFQDPADTTNVDIKNGFTMDVSGAIYMPGVDVDFKNGLDFAVRNCTLFLAKSLTIKNGNGAFNSSGCAATYGGAAFLTASIAR